ncbi:MAG: exodeoxyribonuclease VII small subunit [Anaerolineae bacterium]|jgi:exodeoxyribonuclease VII small subunit|nr:MAG: exodeoxyribonuclease VII small subunit [Anaerolineae bacterium]
MSENFSLEEALKQLEEIVYQLESGNVRLDEAVALFEKGQQLVQQCENDLDAKELRIQQLVSGDRLAPFTP